MDKFYSFVTKQDDAFYKLCIILPDVIQDVLKNTQKIEIKKDTAYEELLDNANNYSSFILALYMLGFGDYIGFSALK